MVKIKLYLEYSLKFHLHRIVLVVRGSRFWHVAGLVISHIFLIKFDYMYGNNIHKQVKNFVLTYYKTNGHSFPYK